MKILVISLAGIGDTLFATPLIHELRLNFPGATIDALVMWAGSKDILQGNPHLNEVHQRNLIQTGAAGSLRFLLGLRRHRYDISLNTLPQSRVQYRIVARLIGAQLRVSHDYDHARWLTPLLVHRTLPQDYTKHCVENNLALLGLLGAQPKLAQHNCELFLTASEHDWAKEFVNQHGLSRFKLLGIHVGSGGTKNLALRRWPLENYAELIRRLNTAHPELAVMLFGGPEEERDHQRLLSMVDGERIFVPKAGNLRQATALIGKCDLFLSVDTALMHLAAAMQVPRQIVIETPTWNKTVEPYGRSFVLVKNPAVAGRNLDFYRYDGRGIRGTPEQLRQCMASVSVESVYRAVAGALHGGT